MPRRASGNPGLDALIVLAEELFAPLGAISIRRMFGGAGLYANGQIFGLLADTIYLKTDDQMDPLLDEAGDCPRFQPFGPDGETMAYRRIPDSALDDPDEAVRWGRLALDVALRAKQRSRSRKPKSASDA